MRSVFLALDIGTNSKEMLPLENSFFYVKWSSYSGIYLMTERKKENTVLHVYL
jgi:hypothetical protein